MPSKGRIIASSAAPPAREVRQPSRRHQRNDPDRRRADAELVLTSVEATAAWEQATGRRSAATPLRELIWYVWERTRLPGRLYRSKYPLEVL